MAVNNLLAIIILNYNDYETTIKCVNQLLRIGIEYQIVVIDNFSKNESYQVLKEKYSSVSGIVVKRTEKNGGYSYGNNQGILAAQEITDFKYYCIMNPDVIIESNYFEELCHCLSKMPEYAVISPLMLYPDKLDLTKISCNLRTSKEIYKHHLLLNKQANITYKSRYKYIGNSLIEAEAVPGSCFIIDAKILCEIGLFDDKCFLYNEESILAIKLKRIEKKYLISLKHNFIHNHNYEIPRKEVWGNYKDNFDKVFRDYRITYDSRKYLCEAYYDGEYLFRLKLVNIINIFLLYLKHIIAKTFH